MASCVWWKKGMDGPFDVLIVGGGPAGLTAGLYAARAGLRTAILEKLGAGGQAAITDFVENYPGFPDGVSGWELADRMKRQAEKFGAELITAEVTGIKKLDALVLVNTAEGDFNATAVILAMGASPRKLGAPGEDDFRGKGVSYCATCDGPLFKGKDVVVVGGGNSAAQESLFLARYCKSVTIVHRRDRMRALPTMQKRLETTANVRFMWNSVVEEIVGADRLNGVKVAPSGGGETKDVSCDGVFIFVGYTPNTHFVRSTVDVDEHGYIVTDEHMRTSVPGIFACGDARRKTNMQLVIACGEAATASLTAQHYVDERAGTAYE